MFYLKLLVPSKHILELKVFFQLLLPHVVNMQEKAQAK